MSRAAEAPPGASEGFRPECQPEPVLVVVDLREELLSLARQLRPLLDEIDVDIMFSFDEPGDVRIETDPGILMLVLRSLILGGCVARHQGIIDVDIYVGVATIELKVSHPFCRELEDGTTVEVPDPWARAAVRLLNGSVGETEVIPGVGTQVVLTVPKHHSSLATAQNNVGMSLGNSKASTSPENMASRMSQRRSRAPSQD